MTAYPPEWSVYGELEFEAFNLANDGIDGLGMVLLSRVDLFGRFTGAFKCCVYGTTNSSFRIPAQRVFPNPPPEVASLFLDIPVDAADLTPPNNSVANPWKDFLACIKERSICVVNEDGDPENPTVVTDYLSALAENSAGSSCRWVIAASPSTTPPTVQAEFQVLPAPAKSLVKSNLKAENCVSIQVIFALNVFALQMFILSHCPVIYTNIYQYHFLK